MAKRELPKYNAVGLPIKWFGLADGNSFYSSCEVSQKPWLDGQPMIVTSNSDKIAIALNRQAKAIGLKLGDLLFEHVNTIREHKILIYPSNYELYGNMSADMHTALASFVQNYEVSSIDYQNLNIIKSRSLILFRIKCNGIRLSTSAFD